VRSLGQQVERIGHGITRFEHERGVPHRVPGLDPAHDLGHRRRRDVLRQHGERAPPGQRLGHPAPGHRGHVRRDHRHLGTGTVGPGQVHIEPRGDRGPARDEEHVVVGEVVLGLLTVEEAHGG
jgi:hypothetical protein